MITTSIKTCDYDYLIKVLAVWWRGHPRPVTAPSECDSNPNGVCGTPTEQLALVHLHPMVDWWYKLIYNKGPVLFLGSPSRAMAGLDDALSQLSLLARSNLW